jgi:hypothetical protein
VDLTRFRGRLTRPRIGAEVGYGIEQEIGPVELPDFRGGC